MNTPDVALSDRLAPIFTDLLGRAFERKPYIVEGRRKLVASSEGRVLEIGGGTGFNLPHYGGGISELVVTDPLDGMLRRAERRGRKLGRQLVTRRASAEALPFEDGRSTRSSGRSSSARSRIRTARSRRSAAS